MGNYEKKCYVKVARSNPDEDAAINLFQNVNPRVALPLVFGYEKKMSSRHECAGCGPFSLNERLNFHVIVT